MHARTRVHPDVHASRAPLREPLELAVLGAGSWGTALAASARRAGLPTRLWSRRPDVAHAIGTSGRNPRHLPGIDLPAGLQASDDLEWVLRQADVVLFAVPCAALREVASTAAASLPRHALLLATGKGIEPGSGSLMTQVLRETCGEGPVAGALAGPSFADEVARGLPARLTLGLSAQTGAAGAAARQLARVWRGGNIELETCDDEIGVQVAGALKNAVAIACGMASAQGLGENARAAIVARGLEDMLRLTLALGGRGETLFRSSGVGDLFLTASSSHSRNTRLGLRLGSEPAQRAEAPPGGGELAEGALACHALEVLERRLQIPLHIPRAVRDVLAGSCSAQRALQRLLAEASESSPRTLAQRGAGHAAPAHATVSDVGAVRVPAGAWNHRVVQ